MARNIRVRDRPISAAASEGVYAIRLSWDLEFESIVHWFALYRCNGVPCRPVGPHTQYLAANRGNIGRKRPEKAGNRPEIQPSELPALVFRRHRWVISVTFFLISLSVGHSLPLSRK